MKMKNYLFTLLLGFSVVANGQKYVFYLHGKIIENKGPNAVDNTNGYGAYKYYDILDSIRKKGFTVISEPRPKDTQLKPYALKVTAQIDSLVKRGVTPSDITVIGASKGAMIAMLTSSYAKNKSVNYVFMAACTDDIIETLPDINCYGNILSVYEKSDQPKSCIKLKNQSPNITHYKEIEINTGLRHGFLYRPIPEWLSPALKWAGNEYN
jgi:hypothetical protein